MARDGEWGFTGMNGNQKQNNIGEQIKDALTDALQSGDFKNLNDLVSQTVTDTLNEVGKRIIKEVGSPEDSSGRKQQTGEKKKNKKKDTDNNTKDKQEHRQPAEPQHTVRVPAVKKENVGKVPGILYQVFGGIGMGITGLATLGRLFFILIGAAVIQAGLLVNLALLAGFAGMIGVGAGKLNRLRRADRYIRLCGPKMYENIDRLAKETGKSCSYVRKDILKMLQAGIFPEGHMDGQKTCLMLNDTVYGQYLEVEENRRIREEEKRQERTADSVQTGDKTNDNSMENELNAMVAEGMECIRRLRELNDDIEGEVISGKLSRLEKLLKEIFDRVREHPEQMHRMHKPMDYYLPTTLKLVEAYEEFDRISVPGEEVLQAKAEIEKTLDTINQAFEELLNNLFQDAAFDATTDAQVLKSMLAREGLTKEMEDTL